MPTSGNSRTWTIRSGKDLGRAISGVRHESGLSQSELAERTGIERTYLSRLETESSTLALDRALRVLRRMGAEVVVNLPEPLEGNRGETER